MANPVDIESGLIEEVLSIADRAGSAVMEVYAGSDPGTTYKEDNSPLTRADTASNDIIVSSLGEAAPDIPVLSEESRSVPYSERSAWGSFWLVDPLDGTKEFLKKNGEFTINIALVEGTTPVVGVVAAPALGLTYYAAKGRGAFKLTGGSGPERIKVAGCEGRTPRVVASRSHRGELLEAFLKSIGESESLSMGSSLKFCLVAEGTADLYPRFGPTMEWDTAAAQVVVECAGGEVTDLAGERLRYNKPDLHNPFFMVSGTPPFPWRNFLNKIKGEKLK